MPVAQRLHGWHADSDARNLGKDLIRPAEPRTINDVSFMAAQHRASRFVGVESGADTVKSMFGTRPRLQRYSERSCRHYTWESAKAGTKISG